MRVGIAADHGGFDLKQGLLVQLRAAGYLPVNQAASGQPFAIGFGFGPRGHY